MVSRLIAFTTRDRGPTTRRRIHDETEDPRRLVGSARDQRDFLRGADASETARPWRGKLTVGPSESISAVSFHSQRIRRN